jgi:periplasmic divalent cation tolerance protein
MTASEALVIVQTTVTTEPQAMDLAQRIVDSRLAACVQVFPIRSVYRWKGQRETAGEYLLAAKTPLALARQLGDFITGTHPYELPELVVLPITEASAAYARWVLAETEPAGGSSVVDQP